jgi:hypothetical protein
VRAEITRLVGVFLFDPSLDQMIDQNISILLQSLGELRYMKNQQSKQRGSGLVVKLMLTS